MAKLHELAPAYYAAADRLTDKINELKLDVKEETDPVRRGRLEHKLYKLRITRKEVLDIGRLCEHYYERGFYRGTSNYGPAPVVVRQHRKPAGVGAGKRAGQLGGVDPCETKPKERTERAIDPETADVLVDVLLRGPLHGRNRGKGRRKQVHREPDSCTGQSAPQ